MVEVSSRTGRLQEKQQEEGEEEEEEGAEKVTCNNPAGTVPEDLAPRRATPS